MAENALQPTQQATQPVDRLGRHSSYMSAEDLANTICVLNPIGVQASQAVQATMLAAPQHILQNDDLTEITEDDLLLPQFQERQIALRLSSPVKSERDGFIFGRNPNSCDILLSNNPVEKLISNKHFKIFVNSHGSLMLQDLSTNGTLVDDKMLKARGKPSMSHPPMRALENGTIISVLGGPDKTEVKFTIRIPTRDEQQEEYEENLRQYLEARGTTANFTSVRESHFGNHWNGGSEYNFTGNLGKGAFATVYRIQTKHEGHLFAAKEIDKRRFMKNGILDVKFDNELKIMQNLKHPNIVEYIDCQRHDNWIYIIMEFVPHGELSEELRKRGSIPEPEVQQIVRQIIHALSYLHQRGITHRDIKPDNILIASREPLIVKLSDFGLSKSVADQETFLKTFCGTLLYCAPEVYPDYAQYSRGLTPKRRRAGDPSPRPTPYDNSVDMWSFGAVIFHLLAGKAPILGRGDDRGAQMLDNIMTKEIDFTPLRDRNVSEEAIDFVHQLLRRNPIDRQRESECLNHPWLRNVPDLFDYADEGPAPELIRRALTAVEEADEDDVDMVVAHELQQISQSRAQQDQVSPLSPHLPNKRRKLTTDGASEEGAVTYPSLPSLTSVQSPFAPPTAPGRLFGEIDERALRSSGVLGADAPFAATGAMPEIRNRVEQISVNDFRSANPDSSPDGMEVSFQAPLHPQAFTTPQLNPPGSAASLLGAEAQIGDLQVGSPTGDANGTTEHVSVNTHAPTTRQLSPSSPPPPSEPNGLHLRSQPAKFSRMVDLNLINDDSAFAAERVARDASRQDKRQKAETFQAGQNSTHAPSLDFARTIDVTTGKERISEYPTSDNDLQRRLITMNSSPASSNFVRPPRRFGRLITTSGSFADVTINLEKRTTAWGRDSICDVRYHNLQETRIPKIALKIFFIAKGMLQWEKDGKNWTDCPGIETIISTSASNGILVNETKLKMISDSGDAGLYGKIYNGDVIIIQQPGDPTFLKFKVEITFGDSARYRPEEEKPFVVERDVKGYEDHVLRKSMHQSKVNEAKAMSELNGRPGGRRIENEAPATASMPAALPTQA